MVKLVHNDLLGMIRDSKTAPDAGLQDMPGASVRFDDILARQLHETNKPSEPESRRESALQPREDARPPDSPAETAHHPAPRASEDDSRVRDNEANREPETKEQNAISEKADSAQRNGDDSDAGEQSDEDHRTHRGRTIDPLLMDLVNPRATDAKPGGNAAIQDLVEKTRAALDAIIKKGASKTGDARDAALMNTLRELGRELEALSGNASPQGHRQQLQALLQKIKTNISTLDGNAAHVADRELGQLIQGLKKHIGEIMTALSKSDKGAAQDFASTMNQRRESGEPRPATERAFVPQTAASIDAVEHRPSGNNDSALGFQFSKHGAQTMRMGEPGQPAPRAGLFGEQLQQVMENAKVFIRDSRNGSFSLQMHPESLGKVNVSLGLDHGVLSGRFLVESNEARDLLLENIDQLKEKLAEAGVSVGEFNVNVRDHREHRFDEREQETEFIHRGMPREAGAGYDAPARFSHDGAIDMVI